MILQRPHIVCAASVLLALTLNGCIAAAVPVLASAGVARGATKPSHAQKRARAEATSEEKIATEQPRAATSATQQRQPSSRGPTSQAQITTLTALPPPGGGTGTATDASFAALTAFVVNKATLQSGENSIGNSVVLEDGNPLPKPQFRSCKALPPAIIIDLDIGKAPFDPTLAGQPAAGLADALAAIRASGATVMWASDIPVAKAQLVYDRLRQTGLDASGTDRLLLVRSSDERKQTRRVEATKHWCILAIAGDTNSDFDELFDYLRDPTFALPLAFLNNAGWFTTPPPITPASTSPITEKLTP